MYSLVQSFGQQLMRAPDHSEFSLPCLVEDQHSIRMALTTESLSTSAWESCRLGGAQGLIRVTRQGFAFTTAEHFAQHSTRNPYADAYELHDRHWIGIAEWGMDFPSLLAVWTERFASGDDPFVSLHTHTDFSAFDGYQTMEEMGQRLTELGQKHFAVADHGVCAGHPAAHQMATEFGLHAIFGMEAYFVNDRFNRQGEPNDYWHLVLIAQNDEGLRNLWAASTESFRDGMWKTPKLDWDTLARFNSGLLITTGCLRGPLADPYLKGEEEQALANLARLGDLFGDRLFIELHTTKLADQMKTNQWAVEVSTRTGVPLVAVTDAHYARKEQRRDHKVWIAMQTGDDVSDDTDLFSGDNTSYHLHSIHEVREALSYLPDDVVEKSIAMTGAIAESCTAEIRPKIVTPVYSRPTPEHPDPVRHDVERFMDAIDKGFKERVLDKGLDPAPHLAKLEYEIPLLVEKKFLGYFLMCMDFVQWAKYDGGARGRILVGPGRGSGGASEAAWLMKITELDPVEGNLLIDRFLTEGRTELPDFDIDFPSSRGEDVITYVQERWGHEHVARVGSHMRIKNKSAFRDTQRAISSELPGESYSWVETINKLVRQAEASTAGLGLSWDELMDQVGDLLQPFRDRMPELFRLAREFHMRLKTYGKHAAGVIINPDVNLEETLPMRRGEAKEDGEAPMITQFDMEALTYLGEVKFDLLRLRNLDTIDLTINMIDQGTGRRIDPYEWHEEYADPEVFEALSEGWTLGVFQIETPLGTRVTRQLKPKNRNDLTNIITIGRPGPLRSGLDKIYMRRRDGLEQVTYPDPRLESVLADTYGVMLYQEDIMNICKVLAGYTSDEADKVRKILGKKQVEKVAAEGIKFIERAVANGTDRQVAYDLWEQMKEFAKYSFNRAHAYAYATIGCWTAWLKVHYARQALTSAMATIKKERIPQFVNEARRLGYEVLPPDINISKRGFAAEGLQIRYGFESLSGIAAAGAAAIMQGQPYTSYEDFMERRGKAADMGVVKRLVFIGAFDSLHPNRRALEAEVIDAASQADQECMHLDRDFANKYNSLPCHFDWDSEPKKLGRPNKAGERKLLKTQPVPPTTCRRKACRQYVQKPRIDYSGLPNYSEEEIRQREVEMLGVFLSSSPFDIVPAEVMADLITADELAVTENGVYPVVGVVAKIRPDPKGRDFGFADILTPSGELSVIMWSKDFERLRPIMTKGRIGFARIIKSNDDRYRLDMFEPLQ